MPWPRCGLRRRQRPADVRLAETLANLYRQDETSWEPAERQRLADEAMNRLVAAAPNNVESYLARSAYRARYGIEGADADLHRAQELAPEDPRVLYVSAQLAFRENKLAEAAAFYEKLLAAGPANSAAYLGLGESLAAQGELLKAVETWRRGLAVDAGNPLLSVRLAETLLQLGRADEAQAILDDLDRILAVQISSQNAASVEAARALQPGVNLLRARWLLQREEPFAATALLRRVTREAEPRVAAEFAGNIALQAWLLLGATYARQASWERAAAAYKQAVELSPTRTEALLGAAKAQAAVGQLDAAIRHCQTAMAAGNSSPEAHLLLIRLLLRRQLSLDPGRRDLKIVEDALEAAGPVVPDAWRWIC